MNWDLIYLDTFIPELPKQINQNFSSFKRYLDIFFDENQEILIKPLETTGRVKASRGEFVTAIVDNLVVKNQFTNLYDNNTTADYNWYKMYIEGCVIPRDPCTAVTYWPFENYPGTKVIDVNRPYYKIDNDCTYYLNNKNLSQVVGIYFDGSTLTSDRYKIMLDPCSGMIYEVDASLSGRAYMEFICTAYDASWGSTWSQYKYGVDDPSIEGAAGVGPGTVGHLAMFTAPNHVGDSSLYIEGNVFYVDGSLILNGTELGPVIYNPTLPDSLVMPDAVGGIPADTSVGGLRGKTLEMLFNDMFFPTVAAYIGTARSASLSGVAGSTVEVGTSITASVNATYNPGQIMNGNDTAGPAVTGDANQYTFTLPGGATDAVIAATGNTQAHTFAPYVLASVTSFTWGVSIDYNAGTGDYRDNKGNIMHNLDPQRIASSVLASSSSIAARRYSWRGYGVHGSAPATSAGVRALSSKIFLSASNTGTFDISIPAGTQDVYFYVPAGKTVVVQYVESSFADVTGSFSQTPISVDDANGTPQSYTSYVSYIGVGGYPSTATYRVTIS